MTFDPYTPYGPPVESTLRLVTWNVWGRYGDADARQQLLDETLARVRPDVVCLTEAWTRSRDDQAAHVASLLGLEHARFDGDLPEGDEWSSGVGVASRWPVDDHQRRSLDGDDGTALGTATFTRLAGPRGAVDVFTVMLDYPLGASAVRQAQVRQLLDFVAEAGSRRHPVIVCGDFNAGPDSDEIRQLTGRAASPVPGLVFYDAWEVAGGAGPGHTFARDNVLAAPTLFPDRRFDYILSAWPRRGGAGHPVHCEVIGAAPPGTMPASDHYGVLADLRY